MKKQCQFVLLPTDKASNILLRPTGELFCSTEFILRYNEGSKLQHLYILSDDKVKENDWYISNGTLYKADKNNYQNNLPKWFGGKVIATTNPELNKNYIKEALIQPLSPDDDASANAWMDSKLKNELKNTIPAISQSDIEYIISLYNEKGREVDIEKLANKHLEISCVYSDNEMVEYEEAYEDGNFPNNRLTPKLKDGCIIIRN